MPVTFDEGRDAMLGIFWAVWQPLGFPVTYTDVPAVTPTENKVWSRPTIRHQIGAQGSLAGSTGTKIYDRKGLIWIQVFAPPGDGLVAGYAAAQALVNAFEDAKQDVWFRNVRLEEFGNDKGFERLDVKADFEYTDVR